MHNIKKWKIEVILKSGKELVMYYKGNEDCTDAVARKVLLVGNENMFNGFSNEDDTKNVFVKLGEIASVSISVA